MKDLETSDSEDTFASSTVTQANPNLLTGIISATCFDNYFALGTQIEIRPLINKADDHNLSKHEIYNGDRASNKSDPTIYKQVEHRKIISCHIFSRRFPRVAQNTCDEAEHHLLTQE